MIAVLRFSEGVAATRTSSSRRVGGDEGVYAGCGIAVVPTWSMLGDTATPAPSPNQFWMVSRGMHGRSSRLLSRNPGFESALASRPALQANVPYLQDLTCLPADIALRQSRLVLVVDLANLTDPSRIVLKRLDPVNHYHNNV
jgi:hypothetical protein